MGRPKGSGGRYIFVREPPGQSRSVAIGIGRGVWHEAGSPGRVQLRRLRREYPTKLYLVPCEAPIGYAVSQSTGPGLGMPKFGIGLSVWREAGLVPGRFAATVENGVIVVDLAQPVEKGYR